MVTIDGKTIKHVPQATPALQNVAGDVLGGKALLGWEWNTGRALAIATDPDGHTSEAKLTRDLLPQIRVKRSQTDL